MALTKVTGDFIKAGSITQGHLHSSHGITTTHIAEGDKLFFTNARVDSRVGSLSTSNLSEGTNLYYTNARADARIALQVGSNLDLSSKSTSDLSEGTNLYYTQARFNTAFTAKSTSDLSEGTNLYYTDARADARITAADTDSLSEGSTNLYYTDARADARVALIVDSAPGTLNTLNELADALGDDANFSTTVTNSIALKAPKASPTFTGSSHFTGNVEVGDGTNISMDSSSNGQLMIDGNGYQGAIALDGQAMYIYHNSSGRSLVLGTNETARLTITGGGNATFTGTITASGYNDSNWNTAYGWGDHGAVGYLTSFTETNVFLGDGGNASTHPGTSKLIYSGQISAGTGVLGMPTINNANAFINLNKHAGEYNSQLGFSSNGHIYYRNFNNTAINGTQTWHKVYTENVFANNSANWNTAYGWGDHGAAGYLASSSYTASDVLTKIKTVDGSGSGLDADLLDGINSTGFVKQLADLTSGAPDYQTPSSRRVDPNSGNPTNAHYAISTFGNGGNVTGQLAVHLSNGSGYIRSHNNSWSDWRKLWHDNNDGSGSGLDADLLDGVQGSSYLRSDTSDTFNGTLTMGGTLALQNNSISGVNHITINDAGVNEGISWSGGNNWYIQECPDAMTNAAGNLQISTGTTRRFTVDTSGNVEAPTTTGVISAGNHVAINCAQWASSGASTGAIKITLPGSTSNHSMPIIRVSTYEYNSRAHVIYTISGHNWSTASNWYNTGVTSEGSDPLTVRLGHDGSTHCIVIGDTNTSWSYGHVTVELLAHPQFYSNNQDMTVGWGASQITSLPSTLTTVGVGKIWHSNNDGSTSGLDADLLDGQHASAFQAAGSYAPAGGSYGTDWYANSLYHDDWVRNHTNNNGHYWSSTGWHLYPRNSEFFYIRSGLTTSTGLAMVCGNETVRGYVYADSSSNIGLLNNAGQWSLQCDNSKNVTAHGSSRAPIFYDSDNTAFYVDPSNGSNGVSANLQGRIQVGTFSSSQANTGEAWIGRASDRSAGVLTVQLGTGTGRKFEVVDYNWTTVEFSADDSGVATAAASFRAPIFYDSNDTGYYLNPASTSNVNAMNFAGVIDANGGHGGINITNTSILSSATSTWTGDPGGAGKIQYHSNRWYIVSDSSSNRIVQFRKNNLDKSYIDNDGRLIGAPDARAPIFYDSNNTAYYVDPASTGRVNNFQLKGAINLPSSGLSTVSGRPAYSIYQEGGAWSSPFPDLCIAMHTGIKFGAHSTYNGMRFYNDYTMATQVMSINNGSDGLGGNHVYVNNTLQAGSSLRAPIFYDSNDTSYYVNPAGLSDFHSIKTTSSVDIAPRWDTSFYVAQSQHYYGHTSTQTMYLGEANHINIKMIADIHGQARAPIYYDRDNTAYYGDFGSTSNINALTLIGTLSGQNAYFAQSVGIGFTSGNIGGRLNVKNSAAGQIAAKLELGSSVNSSSTGVFVNTTASYASSGMFLHFQSNHISGDDNVLIAYLDGDIVNKNNSYTQYSDQRLKENIVDATSKLEEIKQIRVRNFNFIGEDLKQIGVVAQELEPIFPGLVKEREVPGHDDPIKTVKYSVMVPILIKAMQEQQTVIDDLKSRLETLENQ